MRMMNMRALLLCLALSVSCGLHAAVAAENDKSKEEEPKTIAELTKGADRLDGLFTLFRDPKTGETSMLVKKDQLGKEFIYFLHVANGVVDAGFFKGAYGPSFIFTIERRFDKLEFVRQNTSFYFDPDNAISRASAANISPAVLAVEKIASEDAGSGDILIKADKLFLSEAFVQIKPSPNPDADPKTDFSLGSLDGFTIYVQFYLLPIANGRGHLCGNSGFQYSAHQWETRPKAGA